MIFGARKLHGLITRWHRKSDIVFGRFDSVNSSDNKETETD